MNCGCPIAPAQEPFSLRQVDVPGVEDRQRVEQLRPEHRAATVVVRERRERRHQRPHAAETPEVGFEPPDGNQHVRRHLVRRRHLLEDRARASCASAGRAGSWARRCVARCTASSVSLNSAWDLSRLRICSTGVMSASAVAMVGAEMPRASASSRTPCSQAGKGTDGVVGATTVPPSDNTGAGSGSWAAAISALPCTSPTSRIHVRAMTIDPMMPDT